jgi:hypothetical protein
MSMAAEWQENLNQEIREAASDQQLPNIYFNAFTIGASAADLVIILKRNNKPVGLLNVNYSVALTLVSHLSKLIANHENVTEIPIKTTNELEAKLKGSQNDN